MVSITPVLQINGNDYSDILKEVGMKITRTKRMGGSGGPMKDGSMTVDVLAIKDTITFTTKGTAPARLSALLAELESDYVEVTYIATNNQERTATFIPGEAVEVPVGYFLNGEIGFFNSTTVTLTEK